MSSLWQLVTAGDKLYGHKEVSWLGLHGIVCFFLKRHRVYVT